MIGIAAGCDGGQSHTGSAVIPEPEVLKDLELVVINLSDEVILRFDVSFPEEQKEFRFENVEVGDRIVIPVDSVSVPPDFIFKWRVAQEGGEHWFGQTNWFMFATYRTEEWDISKDVFVIELNKDASATTGYQE